MSTLRDWPKKDALIPTGSHLQEPVDNLRDLAKQVSLIIKSEVGHPQERLLVKIVSAGPNGEADYMDGRYWLQKIAVLAGKQNDAVKIKNDNAEQNAGSKVDSIFTGTNCPEWHAMTHGLPVDGSQIFECFGWWDVGSPNRKHYFFSAVSRDDVVAKLTANRSYAGKYDGFVYPGSPNDDGTGDLTMPDGLAAGQSCLVINADEGSETGVGSNTHRLKLNTFLPGEYLGLSKETPPRPIILVHGGVGKHASPKNLPNGTLGAPDTTTYNRDTDDEGCTFTPFIEAYDATSHTLWWHTRTPIYDSRGFLYSVSAAAEHTKVMVPITVIKSIDSVVCNGDGTITINATSGTIVSVE
jgi:hypothetical protein